MPKFVEKIGKISKGHSVTRTLGLVRTHMLHLFVLISFNTEKFKGPYKFHFRSF